MQRSCVGPSSSFVPVCCCIRYKNKGRMYYLLPRRYLSVLLIQSSRGGLKTSSSTLDQGTYFNWAFLVVTLFFPPTRWRCSAKARAADRPAFRRDADTVFPGFAI